MAVTKLAYQLQEHQRRVADRMQNTRGLIARHGLGSGKTLTMLHTAQEQLSKNPNGKVLFIVPASLQENIKKEIKKHNIKVPEDRLILKSYEKAVNDADQLKNEKIIFSAADEAHKLRNNDTKRGKIIREILDNSNKVLLSTATPNYNKLRDIAPLINIANKEKVVPEGTDFDKKFITKYKPANKFLGMTLEPEQPQRLKDSQQLRKLISQTMDIHAGSDAEFPEERQSIIKTPMNKTKQFRLYKFLEQELPPHLARKVRKGLPMTKKEKAQLNVFSTGVRQASNTTRPYVDNAVEEEDPKINTALQRLIERRQQDPNHKALVYSNYLNAGLNPYADKLKQNNIPHRLFTGSLTKKEKNQIINDYNDPKSKLNTLLVSSSGGEGLDLKNTRQVQVLEPHFNKSKIDQVVGRAARYKSHSTLPKEKRNVDIEHYLATEPIKRRIFSRPQQTIDSYLHESSIEKDQLGKELF